QVGAVEDRSAWPRHHHARRLEDDHRLGHPRPRRQTRCVLESQWACERLDARTVLIDASHSTNLSHPEVHLKPGRFSRIWQHPCDLCCLAIARYKRTMRLHVKDALLSLLLCLLAMPAALAQDQELARGKQKQGRSNGAYQTSREEPDQEHRAQPLTLDEGLAILGAALDSRHHASRSDCSHFVHGLY